MSDSNVIDNLIVNSLGQLNVISEEYNSIIKKNNISLIFPACYDKNGNQKNKRISEQEAGVLFCNQLINNNIFFSIETPTIKKYSFSGKGECSGNIDVCIFEKNDNIFSRKNCIEFKSHNVKQKNIDKDIEKLVCEEGINYFIHILPNVDKETLNNVVKKYIAALSNKKIYNHITKVVEDKEKLSQSLILYICVLGPEFCILKKEIKIKQMDWDKCDNSYFMSKMKIKYIVRDENIIFENNNWEIK